MATALINGKLYVAGGTINNGTQIGTVEMYDPSTNTWVTKASLPDYIKRSGFVAGVIDGKLYLAGGQKLGVPTNELLVYDPGQDSWAKGPDLPDVCDGAAGGVTNKKLYVVGGATGGATKNWVYDPAIPSWDVTNEPMPEGRNQPTGGVINGELYVAGGFDAIGATSTLLVYNASSDTWSTRADMTAARYRGAADTIDGKLYLVGGGSSLGLIAEVWGYTPPTIVDTHTITASAGSGGSINPSGTVTVNEGESPVFTFTPDPGYSIADVAIDGFSIGPVVSYTFDNVIANHTIDVAFAIDTPETPAQAIQNVIQDLKEEIDLPSGMENSLISKLESAMNSLEKGQENAAVNKLSAFINQVEAQSGKKIDSEVAQQLIDAVEEIKATLGQQ